MKSIDIKKPYRENEQPWRPQLECAEFIKIPRVPKPNLGSKDYESMPLSVFNNEAF